MASLAQRAKKGVPERAQKGVKMGYKGLVRKCQKGPFWAILAKRPKRQNGPYRGPTIWPLFGQKGHFGQNGQKCPKWPFSDKGPRTGFGPFWDPFLSPSERRSRGAYCSRASGGPLLNKGPKRGSQKGPKKGSKRGQNGQKWPFLGPLFEPPRGPFQALKHEF